ELPNESADLPKDLYPHDRTLFGIAAQHDESYRKSGFGIRHHRVTRREACLTGTVARHTNRTRPVVRYLQVPLGGLVGMRNDELTRIRRIEFYNPWLRHCFTPPLENSQDSSPKKLGAPSVALRPCRRAF